MIEITGVETNAISTPRMRVDQLRRWVETGWADDAHVVSELRTLEIEMDRALEWLRALRNAGVEIPQGLAWSNFAAQRGWNQRDGAPE